MKIEKKELTLDDELPSYKSIDLDVRIAGFKVDYLVMLILFIAFPVLYIVIRVFLVLLFDWEFVPDGKIMFFLLPIIPIFLFLWIFDRKKHDLKVLYYYLYWLIKRKNYYFFNKTNAFLAAKPMSEIEMQKYVKK